MTILLFKFFLVAFSSVMFRLRGSGLKRWIWVLYVVAICGYAAWPYDYIVFSMLVWFHIVFGIFPTQSLFSAIHGEPFGRRDKWPFSIMQDIAGNGGTVSGILYGAIRGLLVMPAAIILSTKNPLVLFSIIPAVGHGLAYYFTKQVKAAEYIIGAFLGLLLVAFV